MKNTKFLIIATLVLISCGPSEEQIAEELRMMEETRIAEEKRKEEARIAEEKRKKNVAIVTCNFMGETRNMDSALRVKEINSARESIGKEPYLGTDFGIKESFKYGLCIDLVLNKPNYESKLKAIKLKESDERRKKQVAEYERQQNFMIEKAKREKKEEQERVIKVEKYTKAITEVLFDHPVKTELVHFNLGMDFFDKGASINIALTSSSIIGFNFDLVVEFIDGLGEIRLENQMILSQPSTYYLKSGKFDNFTKYEYFNEYKETNQPVKSFEMRALWSDFSDGSGDLYGFSKEIIDLLYEDNPKDFIKSIYLHWDGSIRAESFIDMFDDRKEKREMLKKVDPKTYGLSYGAQINLTNIQSKFYVYKKE